MVKGVGVFAVTVLSMTLPLLGFRPTGGFTTETMELREVAQPGRGHIEYMAMVTVRADGSVREHRVLRMFQQSDTERFTHLRLLAPGENAGFALLTRQRAGEYARAWEVTPGKALREVPGDELTTAFADSVWTFGDSLLDWPQASRSEMQRPAMFRGRLVTVVDNYPLPEITGLETGYSFRRYFFDRETAALLCIEYFDENEELIKYLDFLDYVTVRSDGEDLLTATRLQMTHVERRETATLVYQQARFGLELDPVIFTPQELEAWSAAREASVLRVLEVPQ